MPYHRQGGAEGGDLGRHVVGTAQRRAKRRSVVQLQIDFAAVQIEAREELPLGHV